MDPCHDVLLLCACLAKDTMSLEAILDNGPANAVPLCIDLHHFQLLLSQG
jgi:UV DNA damage repair endonuclease